MFILSKIDLISLVLKGEASDFANQLDYDDVEACDDEAYVLTLQRVGASHMCRGSYVMVMQTMLDGVSREMDISVAEYYRLGGIVINAIKPVVERLLRVVALKS